MIKSKIEYEKYIGEIENKSIKALLTKTFDEFLPMVFEGCDSVNDKINMAISFSEMIENVKFEGYSEEMIKDYAIGERFPEFCRSFAESVDAIPDLDEQEKTYKAILHIFMELIFTFDRHRNEG